MIKYMMACGHSSNATLMSTDGPACAICGCVETIEPPDLTGRTARCTYFGGSLHSRNECPTCKANRSCKCEKPSDLSLAFFSYEPTKPYDKYYCGCWGWS